MADLVYIVRPGGNEELRYSLRSAVNLPHDSVWVVGSCPEWVTGVKKYRMTPLDEKWSNIRQSLTAVTECDEVSEDIILMCDDFFILEPLVELPIYHLGPLDEFIIHCSLNRSVGKDTYAMGMREMFEQLKDWGVEKPLSYEGHMPIPYTRDELSGLLALSTCRFLWGCAYSATGGPVGELGGNVKVAGKDRKELEDKLEVGQPFLSTNEESFGQGAVGEYLRDLFPKPGPYER